MRRWVGWMAVALVTAGFFWAWPWLRPAFSGGVRSAADLLAQTGAWGPLVVLLLQSLQAVISPLPSWPITVAAGALYGPVLGTIYSAAGGMLGAIINFLLARRFAQPWVRRRLGERWLDQAGRLGPVHFLILSLFGRLIPVASFDLVAYVAGIGRISLPLFLAVAMAGQVPAFFAYAAFGNDLAEARSAGLWSSLLLLLFVLLILGGHRLWQRLIRP